MGYPTQSLSHSLYLLICLTCLIDFVQKEYWQVLVCELLYFEQNNLSMRPVRTSALSQRGTLLITIQLEYFYFRNFMCLFIYVSPRLTICQSHHLIIYWLLCRITDHEWHLITLITLSEIYVSEIFREKISTIFLSLEL